MRTTIRMNEELARRARQYAAKHDRTFTQVIEEAVLQLLSNGGGAATPRKRTVLPTVGGHSGRTMSEAEYRAMIERMYAEDAERIIGGGRASHRR